MSGQTIAEILERYSDALTDTRTALAAKGQSVSTHGFEDFPDDIAAISAADLVSGTLSITANGTSDVTNYAAVSVNVSGGSITTEALTVTENGTYTAPTGKAYTPVTVNVGSVIPSDLPSDGKTRIGYKIPTIAGTQGYKITLMFYHETSSTSTSVDWGDNSSATNTTGSGRKTLTHTYAAVGDYIVTITINAGNIYFGGGSAYTIYGDYDGADTQYQRPYIQWIVLGTGVTQLSQYSLYHCYNLQEIRFPSTGFTALGNYAMSACYALKNVSIPNTVTTLGTNILSNCSSLETVTLPANNTAKTIGSSSLNNGRRLREINIPSQFTTFNSTSFSGCVSLQYLELPSAASSIAGSAFSSLDSLLKIRFNSATPPAVANSNAFTSLPTTCIISVPTGKKSAYTGAANYPSSSTYTYIEEAS